MEQVSNILECPALGFGHQREWGRALAKTSFLWVFIGAPRGTRTPRLLEVKAMFGQWNSKIRPPLWIL